MANIDINKTTALLLNVPLENDYRHTLYFETKSEQEQYFRSRMVRTFNDLSYQRKDEPIRIPTVDSNGLVSEYDNLINAGINYIMYKNPYYSNKWFYAFITDMKYISDGIVEIYFETDAIQTWLFDYQIKPSFVEREHVSDDTFGKHTVPEGLELGEYVSNYCGNVDMGDMYIVVGTTQVNETKKKGGLYAGVYSGVHYLVWKATNYTKVNEFLNEMDEGGFGDAIQCVFMAPEFVVGEHDTDSDILHPSTTAMTKDLVQWDKNTKILDHYGAHNKKLFTYPYNYLLVSNNNGGSAIYKYEDFSGNEDAAVTFIMYGAICPGASIKLVPMNYKNVDKNLEESINAGKFPICNWNSDAYTNWLTQNGVNIKTSIASSGLQIAGGVGMAMTGAGALAGGSMVASGIVGIASTLGQKHQQSFTPPQVEGNLNCGDVLQAMKKNTFTAYQMSIKEEYARIIDAYFDMFGYKINRVKIPNKAHRRQYWYTKTIDANIDGAIPFKDLQIVKNAYNNGITFWRNGNNVQEYGYNNDIELTSGAITD